jgi:arylformamidase
MVSGREEYGLQLNVFRTSDRYPKYEVDEDVWYIMEDIHMSSHCGTHIELPYHHIEHGLDAASFPLESLIGEAILLDFSSKKPGEAITLDEVKSFETVIRSGDRILFFYDAGKLYYSEQAHDRPYVETDAVRWLIDKKEMKLIGTDGSGFEMKGAVNQPIHQLCLENNVPIIEFAANLDQLTRQRFQLFALPLPIKGLDSSPIRLIAVEEKQ